MVRLNHVLDLDLGHSVSEAYGIDDLGEIIARGRFLHRPWEQLLPFYLLIPDTGEVER